MHNLDVMTHWSEVIAMQKEDVQSTIEKLEAALNDLEEGKSTYSDFGAYFHDELAEAVLHILNESL